ncbi:MAG: DinB family protein [Acidobacteriota bacterium]
MSAEIELLLSILDEAYEKKAWHGPNLRGSLRGISAEQAAWRPGPERHNIWEIAVHAAYWKYAVRRRLSGEKRGSFPLKGSNWFLKPEAVSEKAWQGDLRLLAEQHKQLREVIAAIDPARLSEKTQGSNVTNARTIYGIAAHDLYHAGQIQLLKRLLPSD